MCKKFRSVFRCDEIVVHGFTGIDELPGSITVDDIAVLALELAEIVQCVADDRMVIDSHGRLDESIEIPYPDLHIPGTCVQALRQGLKAEGIDLVHPCVIEDFLLEYFVCRIARYEGKSHCGA